MITETAQRNTKLINILPYKTADSNRNLTSRACLVMLADLIKRLGLNEWVDRFMPAPGNNRGYPPSILFSTFMLMKHDGVKCLESVQESCATQFNSH